MLNVLPEHLNAEIVAGTICSKQDAVDYLTWTYFFRRLLQNPAYYNLEHLEPTMVNHYLSSLIQRSLSVLELASCIELDDDGLVTPTSLGRIASYYYLSYHTMQLFRDRLHGENTLDELLSLLSDAHEYSELPVRHNEDLLNGELAKDCRLAVNQYSLDSSHTKAHLLFQAHFSRLNLPCADYVTDTKSVLDQSIRILQAMMDVAAEGGWLATTLRIQQLLQMVVQAIWIDEPSVCILPHLDPFLLPVLQAQHHDLVHLPVLQHHYGEDPSFVVKLFSNDMDPDQIRELGQVLAGLPAINLALAIRWGGKSFPVPLRPHSTLKDVEWIQVPADQECLLDVTFIRPTAIESSPAPTAATGASGGARPKRPASTVVAAPPPQTSSNNRSNRTAYAPKFPKPKDEGWFLVLGSVERHELLAMKRVNLTRAKCSHQLSFVTPEKPGRFILTLYFISDSYVGLDQQFTIHLEACPSLQHEVDDEV